MNKIQQLKDNLKQNDLDYLLVPMRDEFGCEYVPPQGRRIEFLTNFTGSNAFVIAGKQKSAFFTDGRYTLQAKNEVSSKDFEIHEIVVTSQYKWLENNLKKDDRIGFNPDLFTLKNFELISNIIKNKKAKLVALESDMIDDIWKNRPTSKKSSAFFIDNKEKIKPLTKKIKADFLLETDPENICWLFNIRAKDLDYTPVALCFMILSKNGDYTIFSDNESLKSLGLNTKKIKDFKKELKNIKNKRVQLDGNNCPYSYYKTLKSQNDILDERSPLIAKRSIKTKREIENLKRAHIADGIALTKFFINLEKHINNNKIFSEYKLSEQLSELRSKHPAFYSLSFDVIMGFKDNGAIIHYRPDEKKSKDVKGEGMLLIDSGAQYYGKNIVGTTDVTRTIYIGTPSKEQRRNNTLVLKGHIAVASAKFKKGTSGKELDILARKYLKEEGLDYKHGTGHGVGYFLNVHEGPHAINAINEAPLKEGMIISNEPGYYKEGEYGIRIESLVAVKKSQKKDYLEFETLTKAPIDLNLIDSAMLTNNEKNWLNKYHKDVFEQLSEFLDKSETEWLKTKTRKI